MPWTTSQKRQFLKKNPPILIQSSTSLSPYLLLFFAVVTRQLKTSPSERGEAKHRFQDRSNWQPSTRYSFFSLKKKNRYPVTHQSSWFSNSCNWVANSPLKLFTAARLALLHGSSKKAWVDSAYSIVFKLEIRTSLKKCPSSNWQSRSTKMPHKRRVKCYGGAKSWNLWFPQPKLALNLARTIAEMNNAHYHFASATYMLKTFKFSLNYLK